jgi:ligand-binding sensor domain-containing protein
MLAPFYLLMEWYVVKKLTIFLALILAVLIPSTLIISCQQPSASAPPHLENNSGWTTFTSGSLVHALLAEGNEMWLATGGGVIRWRIDEGTNQKYTTEDGLVDNRVEAIARDRQGNLWFGTYHRGVSRYDGVAWRTFTTEDGLAGNTVLAIAQDGQGNLWFGTAGGGVSRYDGAGWRTFTTRDGLAGNTVWAIAQDGQGNLWFGTAGGGVSRYDGAAWRTYTTEDGLAENTVLAMARDGQGNLWFGTYSCGISYYDGTS